MKSALITLAFLCSLGLVCLGSGCATVQPPATVPVEARPAYTAEQVVLRLNEFQAFVIDQSNTGQLSIATARDTVSYLIKVRTIIDQTPNGWQAAVRTSWLEFRAQLSTLPNFSQWYATLDLLLGGGA